MENHVEIEFPSDPPVPRASMFSTRNVLHMLFRSILVVAALLSGLGVIGGVLFVAVDWEKESVYERVERSITSKIDGPEGEATKRKALEMRVQDLERRAAAVEKQIVDAAAARVWIEVYSTRRRGYEADAAVRVFRARMEHTAWPCPIGLACPSPSEIARDVIDGR